MHLYFLRATNSEQCAALVLNTKLLGLLSNNNKKNKNGLTEKLNEIWEKKKQKSDYRHLLHGENKQGFNAARAAGMNAFNR